MRYVCLFLVLLLIGLYCWQSLLARLPMASYRRLLPIIRDKSILQRENLYFLSPAYIVDISDVEIYDMVTVQWQQMLEAKSKDFLSCSGVIWFLLSVYNHL